MLWSPAFNRPTAHSPLVTPSFNTRSPLVRRSFASRSPLVRRSIVTHFTPRSTPYIHDPAPLHRSLTANRPKE
eukprot:1180154-Prorocentrum_minimum.AAC.7